MNIALAQLNYIVGHFEHNIALITQAIARARDKGAHIIVFSELSVCGYPPYDLLESEAFIDKCRQAIDLIAPHCVGIAAIMGAPTLNTNSCGKRLYNSALLISEGKIEAVYHKGLLPTYDVFDEYRYFEPAHSFKTIPFRGKRIALTICEDIWNLQAPALYRVTPMDEMIKEKPDLIINISASPYAWNNLAERQFVFSENARQYGLPLFVANQMGGHADLIFDGLSGAYNPAGGMVESFEPFTEGIKIFDLSEVVNDATPPGAVMFDEKAKYGSIYKALVFGIKEYFGKLGLSKAILGLSGGLDSALTLVLAAEALGTDNCRAVILPGPHSTLHSVIDAIVLARNLGVQYESISITETVKTLERTLEPWFAGTPSGIAEENIQARARAIILMGLANKFGYVLLNTSNKSEAAVGYGTLYGDMCGGLAVIGDLYKTEAYSLAKYINRHYEIIPANTISKPPSAELKPGQFDTDSLPPYEVLDDILKKYIEDKMAADEIAASGHDIELVRKVLQMVNSSEYKRRQSPPVLRVSKKAFGPGRKMPIVARFPG